ncbi:MAG: hypothetical protein NC548_35255 [Lachnospiraceae bacterium]|nr:hypothetical protein [Lachnospiraceae bacterium]
MVLEVGEQLREKGREEETMGEERVRRYSVVETRDNRKTEAYRQMRKK